MNSSYIFFNYDAQDEGAFVACSILEDLQESSNINQLVRATAIGVGAYCKAKVCDGEGWGRVHCEAQASRGGEQAVVILMKVGDIFSDVGV